MTYSITVSTPIAITESSTSLENYKPAAPSDIASLQYDCDSFRISFPQDEVNCNSDAPSPENADFVAIFAYAIDDCHVACQEATMYAGKNTSYFECAGFVWSADMPNAARSHNANCWLLAFMPETVPKALNVAVKMG